MSSVVGSSGKAQTKEAAEYDAMDGSLLDNKRRTSAMRYRQISNYITKNGQKNNSLTAGRWTVWCRPVAALNICLCRPACKAFHGAYQQNSTVLRGGAALEPANTRSVSR